MSKPTFTGNPRRFNAFGWPIYCFHILIRSKCDFRDLIHGDNDISGLWSFSVYGGGFCGFRVFEIGNFMAPISSVGTTFTFNKRGNLVSMKGMGDDFQFWESYVSHKTTLILKFVRL